MMPDTNALRAELLQEEDAVRVLLDQHQRILALFAGVRAAAGEARLDALRELRALVVVHETAEQLVLRPVSADRIGSGFVDDLTAVENELTNLLAHLEDVPPDLGQFTENLDALEAQTLEHFYVEETEEFPVMLDECPIEDRLQMGRRLIAAMKVLPTRPHPVIDGGGKAATVAAAPITSIVDRVRDAIARDS
jgi:hypothetical protein